MIRWLTFSNFQKICRCSPIVTTNIDWICINKFVIFIFLYQRPTFFTHFDQVYVYVYKKLKNFKDRGFKKSSNWWLTNYNESSQEDATIQHALHTFNPLFTHPTPNSLPDVPGPDTARRSPYKFENVEQSALDHADSHSWPKCSILKRATRLAPESPETPRPPVLPAPPKPLTSGATPSVGGHGTLALWSGHGARDAQNPGPEPRDGDGDVGVVVRRRSGSAVRPTPAVRGVKIGVAAGSASAGFEVFW